MDSGPNYTVVVDDVKLIINRFEINQQRYVQPIYYIGHYEPAEYLPGHHEIEVRAWLYISENWGRKTGSFPHWQPLSRAVAEKAIELTGSDIELQDVYTSSWTRTPALERSGYLFNDEWEVVIRCIPHRPVGFWDSLENRIDTNKKPLKLGGSDDTVKSEGRGRPTVL